MRRSVMFAGLALAAAGSAAGAHAQGSSVMVHSSCATAMAGAQVAEPCDDASAVLYNPAALALQPSTLGLGITGIYGAGSFTYDVTGERVERDAKVTPVPFGFLNYRVNDKLAAAVGAFAPYGLGLAWPLEFEGRFASYDSELRNIYIQPTVSYAPSTFLSFGAGVDVVLASIDINRRLDLAETPLPTQPFPGRTLTFGNLGIAPGTDFANVGLSGSGTGYTFHLGAMARLTEQLSLGARYLHSVQIDYEGDADFERVLTNLTLPRGNPLSAPGNQLGLPVGSPVPLDLVLARSFESGGPLADQGVRTSLELPSQLVVGLGYTPVPGWKILGDLQWTGWSSFDEALIDLQGAGPDAPLILDYQDTRTYRLGTEFVAGDVLTLRAGFIYNEAAQREFAVSPLLPEAERNYYTIGLGYHFNPNLRLDVGYQLVDQSARRGRVRGRPAGLSDAELRALNVGVYETEAHVLNATFAYQFGTRR